MGDRAGGEVRTAMLRRSHREERSTSSRRDERRAPEEAWATAMSSVISMPIELAPKRGLTMYGPAKLGAGTGELSGVSEVKA